MNTLVCVFCCLMALSPNVEIINNGIIDNYDSVIASYVLENNGEYLVGLQTKPFFRRSDKIKFTNDVISYISSENNIPSSKINVVFDLDTIYAMRNVKNQQDIESLLNKVKNSSYKIVK